MSELIIWTLDWVPEAPRGFVRDLELSGAADNGLDDWVGNRLNQLGNVLKARADQLAHFAAADAGRPEAC